MPTFRHGPRIAGNSNQMFPTECLARKTKYDCELLSAHIGQEKSSLDHVNTTLPVVPVITLFGWFLKYSVSIASNSKSQPSSSLTQPTYHSSLLSTNLQPVHQQTMKDKLFNDILQCFVFASVTVRGSEVSSVRKTDYPLA